MLQRMYSKLNALLKCKQGNENYLSLLRHDLIEEGKGEGIQLLKFLAYLVLQLHQIL